LGEVNVHHGAGYPKNPSCNPTGATAMPPCFEERILIHTITKNLTEVFYTFLGFWGTGILISKGYIFQERVHLDNCIE
jgi:hypothetical protein